MPERPLPPLPAVFRSGDSSDHTLTRHQRSRSRQLQRPWRNIRVSRPDEAESTDLAQALARSDRSLVISHDTAALIWGMWVPWPRSGHTIHLSRVSGTGGRPRFTASAGVTGHLLPLTESDINRQSGVRLTSPAWTWTDLASRDLELEDLVCAGDALLQRSSGPPRPPGTFGFNPLATIHQIREVVDRRGRIRGKKLLLQALPLLREGVDSAPETRVRLRLVRAGWPEPEVNPLLRFADGLMVRPDLVFRELQIVVQYEGRHHFEDAAQYRRDIDRDAALRVRGWDTLRVHSDVLTPQGWERFIHRLRIAEQTQRRLLGV